METIRKKRALESYHKTQAVLQRLSEENKAIAAGNKQAVIDHFLFDIPGFIDFFLPHHVPDEFSDFHRIMIEEHRDSTVYGPDGRVGKKSAYVAPRGNAKTTIKTIGCLIHDIVYKLEKYIVVFSAGQTQATQIVRNVRDELLENVTLNRYYRLRWRARGETAFTVNGIRVEGHGLETARRGIKWGEHRPTSVILDDVEEDEQVLSADRRRKIWDRFSRVIEPIGSTATNITILGTMLHQESLLARILKRPDYISYLFKAIEAEPKNTDLWLKWEKILFDIDNPDSAANAQAFYATHAAKMDEGAKVLWPSHESLVDLMGMRLTMGSFAFNAEKQNDPRNPDTQVFFMSQYPKFKSDGAFVISDKGERLSHKDMLKFTYLDPAMGQDGESKQKKGNPDFAAICTIGVDNNGKIWVLDVWMKKALPEEQMARMFDSWQLWGGEMGFEAVGFQRTLLIPWQAEARRRGFDPECDVPISAFDQHKNKIARIMRIEPMCKHNWLLFNETLPQGFVSQMETFPTGSHDDGPDALEGAVSFAQKRGALKFVG